MPAKPPQHDSLLSQAAPSSGAFNYKTDTTEFFNLGRIPVLKVYMNANSPIACDLNRRPFGLVVVMWLAHRPQVRGRGSLASASLTGHPGPRNIPP